MIPKEPKKKKENKDTWELEHSEQQTSERTNATPPPDVVQLQY